MRRMYELNHIVDKLDYEKDNNTLEVGTNLYIDGLIRNGEGNVSLVERWIIVNAEGIVFSTHFYCNEDRRWTISDLTHHLPVQGWHPVYTHTGPTLGGINMRSETELGTIQGMGLDLGQATITSDEWHRIF